MKTAKKPAKRRKPATRTTRARKIAENVIALPRMLDDEITQWLLVDPARAIVIRATELGGVEAVVLAPIGVSCLSDDVVGAVEQIAAVMRGDPEE